MGARPTTRSHPARAPTGLPKVGLTLDFRQWILDTVSEFGYAGIFLLVTVENVFPPIPSELILTFGGFMTTQTSLSVPGVVASATLGSMCGAALLYGVGRLADASRVRGLAQRWGPVLRLNPADVDRAYRWFHRHGTWAVFLCRMVPVLRSLISVPAGSARMRLAWFLVLTALGSLIWNATLVSLGAFLGSSWEVVGGYLDAYAHVVYALLALALAVLLLRAGRVRL
ncbi:MAG: alkaline phosphatase [Bacillota bacterium]|nr:alkaline phosphatase [Bacillota bacterium]REJ37226.1 MAG: alkaline phosphatase [Bacillota bacterium]